MRNDLQQKVGPGKGSKHTLCIDFAVLETHGRGGNAHRPIVERANERVDCHVQLRRRKLFGKSP
jgi:hypothetical protein